MKVKETAAKVAAWKPTDKVNPEELGHYFQGDILLTPEQARDDDFMRNGVIGDKYRWDSPIGVAGKGAVVPYTIDDTFCKHKH